MADAAILDGVFRALADPTRRAVIEQLTQGPASVTELAEPHAMSLPGFLKHLRVLEDAGLVLRVKEGRTVCCELAPGALEDAAVWLARHEEFWAARLDALGRYLYHQEEVQAWPNDKPNRTPRSSSGGITRSPPRKSGRPGPTRRR